MLTKEAKAELEKQQYRVVGSHSAVKPCGWTKNVIRGGGGCYKLKFYGINTVQCLQMSTSISCANRCIYCWRGYKAPVSTEWKWDVDDPEMIVEDSIKAHHQLLIGFKGSPKANKEMYLKSNQVKHVALSLTGEPIQYPKINEVLELFHNKKISTFLVTNMQHPDEIKNLGKVTQLYMSMDSCNKEMMKEVGKPLFPDYWERFLRSIEEFSKKKGRRCIRLTMIKGINDMMPEKYAELLTLTNTDFVEVKAYMHVGESRENLERKNMPLHEEVVEFTKKIIENMPDYDIVSEHIPSRVVLLAKKKYFHDGKWYTWIDFEKFFNGEEEYNAETRLKGTVMDEDTDEMSFYE